MRLLSGIQPSGALHLGNYFGFVRPALELGREHEAYYFVADYHALTTVVDPEALRRNVRALALDLMALGLDPARTVLFRQSDVPEVTELAWLLSTVTPLGLLERAHAYKDKIEHGLAPTHALFAYPVLMAADILLEQADAVPAGEDQRQHLEIARDLAGKFNGRFGPVFRVPEALIGAEVATVPGIDGRKMSKSYGNAIEVFADEDSLRRRVMSIVTDSLAVDAPKDPDRSVLLALHRHLAPAAEHRALVEGYRRGGLGYAELKRTLADRLWAHFAPQRARRQLLERNPGEVDLVLRAGADRARAQARRTLAAARRAVGLD